MMFNVDLDDAPDSVISPTTFLRLTYVCLFLSLRKKRLRVSTENRDSRTIPPGNIRPPGRLLPTEKFLEVIPAECSNILKAKI